MGQSPHSAVGGARSSKRRKVRLRRVEDIVIGSCLAMPRMTFHQRLGIIGELMHQFLIKHMPVLLQCPQMLQHHVSSDSEGPGAELLHTVKILQLHHQHLRHHLCRLLTRGKQRADNGSAPSCSA